MQVEKLIPSVIVFGGQYDDREKFIQNHIDQSEFKNQAIIMEGLPTGNSQLEHLPQVSVVKRLLPACLCCQGNLAFRVSLNSTLRTKPSKLVFAIHSSEHLEKFVALLSNAPYDKHLEKPLWFQV